MNLTGIDVWAPANPTATYMSQRREGRYQEVEYLPWMWSLAAEVVLLLFLDNFFFLLVLHLGPRTKYRVRKLFKNMMLPRLLHVCLSAHITSGSIAGKVGTTMHLFSWHWSRSGGRKGWGVKSPEKAIYLAYSRGSQICCALKSSIVGIPGIPGLWRNNLESSVILDYTGSSKLTWVTWDPVSKIIIIFFNMLMLGPVPEVMAELTFGCFSCSGDTNAQ